MPYDDDRIDALVRAMRRDPGEAAAAIPAEVVHAYLTGRASAAQKTAVRRALSVSPQFRAELIDLANYLETLSSEAAASAYEAAVAPAFAATAAPKPLARAATPSIWQRITAAVQDQLAMPRLLVAVPALSVAVLVVALLPQITWSPLVGPAATTAVDPTRFTTPPGMSRGEGEFEAEQAALRALHQCVRARDGRLEFEAAAAGAAGERLATVHVVNAWRRKLRTLALVLPEGERMPDTSGAAGGKAEDVRVWLFALPEAGEPAALQEFALPADGSMALRLDGARQRGVLVATYRSGGRYYASPCVALDMRER